MKYGILGGTFDPIHLGQLRLAEEAADAFGLDCVHLVLAALPPHKTTRELSPIPLRWRMLELACQGNPRLVPSDLELKRSGPSYTIDTLREFKNKGKPEDKLFLLLGADSAEEIQTWHRYREIFEMASLIALPRKGGARPHPISEIAGRIQILEVPALEISSTRIRHLVATGASIRYLVPDSVESAIREWGLYKVTMQPVQSDANHPCCEVGG
ncbi:MAG: nicotinate (nicotinamide) nucleotide adenylyltransferase [Candidatus Omnitrophica bacterium]|nr:nicotinate (nicotinamide) nucleotide adenylyltransferase [Candidatus Omnitrophota bacterium]